MSTSLLNRALFRLALSLLAAFGCVSPTLATELRLAVSRGPVSLPLYVAEAKGFFAAEGLKVKLLECHSGRECFQQIESGTADLATSAELIVALDSLRSSSATIVATISTSTQHIKLVARRSAGIASSADLRGKRIGTVARTSAQYFLENWLLYHDIATSQVQVVPLAVGQLVKEVVDHRIDAIAIWEPIATEAATRLGPDLSALAAPRVYNQHFVLSISKRNLAARDADVQRLLRGVLHAERLIATSPEDAAEILASRLQLDRASALAALSEHDFRLVLTPTLLSTMDSQARWAIRERVLDTPLGAGAVLHAIDPGPLRKVSPAAVTLPLR